MVTLCVVLGLAGCSYFQKPAPVSYPMPPAASLERVNGQQLLSGPHRFTCGVTLLCQTDDQGLMFVNIESGSQVKQVVVPDQADFYAVTDRPDVVIMHDRFSPVMDTIRVFRFSTTGVRERTHGHAKSTSDYTTRLYANFAMDGKRVTVEEQLSTPSMAGPHVRRYWIPLDD